MLYLSISNIKYCSTLTLVFHWLGHTNAAFGPDTLSSVKIIEFYLCFIQLMYKKNCLHIILKKLSFLEMVLHSGKKLVAKRVDYLSTKKLTAILKLFQSLNKKKILEQRFLMNILKIKWKIENV